MNRKVMTVLISLVVIAVVVRNNTLFTAVSGVTL